jgi:hypothetical protein
VLSAKAVMALAKIPLSLLAAGPIMLGFEIRIHLAGIRTRSKGWTDAGGVYRVMTLPLYAPVNHARL